MSDQQNIPPEESSVGNELANKNGNTSQEETIEQPSNTAIESQTVNMEVHHHPQLHHKPKQWKEYFLEFMMIFLAVTMGFFAENMRENIVNNKKEKHYIQSLAEDIKSDTAQLNNYIRYKTNILNYCDSLQFIITHTNVYKNSNSFYTYSKELAGYLRYYPADRTIQQLKNAGNMQLIHKWNISNAITEYYSRTRSMEEADLELNEEVLRYRRYLIEFLDLSSYDQLNEPGSYMANNIQTKGNPSFISADAEKIKIIYNEVFTLKTFLNNCNQNADALIKDAKNLLILLHAEYNL